MLQIYLDMLRRLREKSVKILIVDISTGHNIYVSSVLEALRAMIVRDKLLNGLRPTIKCQYAVSEPIIRGRSKDKYRIFLNEYDSKAFFDLPIKRDLNQANKPAGIS